MSETEYVHNVSLRLEPKKPSSRPTGLSLSTLLLNSSQSFFVLDGELGERLYDAMIDRSKLREFIAVDCLLALYGSLLELTDIEKRDYLKIVAPNEILELLTKWNVGIEGEITQLFAERILRAIENNEVYFIFYSMKKQENLEQRLLGELSEFLKRGDSWLSFQVVSSLAS